MVEVQARVGERLVAEGEIVFAHVNEAAGGESKIDQKNFVFTILRNVFWKIGVLGDYKRPFWKFAWSQLRRGNIESFIQVSLISHHLITFAREASGGRQNASNYSLKLREAQVPAE